MTVRRLHPQEAEHVESGLKMGSAGRDAVELQLGDHIMTVTVDQGIDAMLYILPKQPHWDDGEPLPPELAANLQAIIGEVSRFWNLEPVFRIH